MSVDSRESARPIWRRPKLNKQTRRSDIQGLRAIAVLQVVAFHAGLPVPGGFVGVDVFFVISGFVITGMLQREWATAGRLDFGRFYLRRFKRLTPALALVVTVTVIVSALLLSPISRQQAASRTGIGAMLLGANKVIANTTGGYFDARAETNPLLNTWSLSVEEQFYLAFPLILMIGWTLGRRSRSVVSASAIIVGAIGIASFGLAVLGSAEYVAPRSYWLIGFYSPFTRAWEFAAGSMLALAVTNRVAITSSAVAGAVGLVGVSGLLGSLWLVSESSRNLGVWTLLPVTATVLLIWSGSNSANPIARMLSTAPLVRVGDWSYSLYLWHWPLIVFAAAIWPANSTALLAAAALSLFPAMASYAWVEEPMRSMQTVNRRRFAGFASAIIIAPIVLAVVVGVSAREGWWTPAIKTAVDNVTATHGSAHSGCFTRGPYEPASAAKCAWNSAGTSAPVYLIGDSNAWQFVEAVTEAGAFLNKPVWVFTAPSCAPTHRVASAWVGKSKFFPPGLFRINEFDHCPGYLNFVLSQLKGARRGIVFIAALDQYWWDPGIGAAFDGEEPTTDADGKLSLLRKGLESTIGDIKESGHHVIIVQTLPTYRNPPPTWDPATCSAFALLRGTCSRTVSLDVIDELQLGSREALSQTAYLTGSSVLDLRNVFCDARVCSTNRGREVLYLDATHITVSASKSLAPEFVKAINAVEGRR